MIVLSSTSKKFVRLQQQLPEMTKRKWVLRPLSFGQVWLKRKYLEWRRECHTKAT